MGRAVTRSDGWDSFLISDEARASHAERKTSALGELSAYEKLLLGHGRANRRKKGNTFSLALAQLREIEKIISSRYGKIVPETDDSDVFIKAALYAINDHCHRVDADFDKAADGWCSRWAPWALPKAGTIIRPILNELVRRKHMLGAQPVAHLLRVTFLERERLQLSVIGAFDISEITRKRIVKDRKRKRDKARQAAIREATGRQNRTSYEAGSLSALRPWLAEGISRRTWERRRVAGLSRVEIYSVGDTLASKGVAGVVLALPSKSLPSLKSRYGAVNSNGGAEQCDVEEKRQVMGGAS